MNAMLVIFPYKFHGQWVFDDEAVGLRQEPLVLGIDRMIEMATAQIPAAEKGFKLFFSATPFPGYAIKLVWRRVEFGGNWYWSDQYQIEGWLCPALFKYFQQAPKEIFAKVEAK
jgi:hypothetical protein